MFFTACLLGLLVLPGVHADGWDDFSNNLAADLAPFLSLFGEQITKQYLSESIATIDYFIFAMAPMGILTAIVSAIRVCGSPSLRAFIGRAQEGGGNAEAELCSSTSRDVCELYNNGGIARVFGRPKILEVVYDPDHNFADEKTGIYTFQEFIERNPKKWTRIQPPESPDNNETISDAFAQNFSPNLSLNVGIKRKSPAIFWTVAMIGMILQVGVLVFAVLVTYYLRWDKDGNRPESYACPLTIAGTLLLCGGIFLCAFLVGESTKEQVFRRHQDDKDKQLSRETLYWVQPGGQVLGDQVFDAFCCSDQGDPLQEYITSWKNQVKISQIVVWTAVSISVAGFVMQFVGLRAIHSAVSVSQLGATMLMSAARAALRMQRLKPEDNFLAQCPDEVVGHELDWLALHIGGQDIHRRPNPSSPAQSLDSPRFLWRFCGTPGNTQGINNSMLHNASRELNVAAKLLAYRTRLAQLTQFQNTPTNGTNSAEHFDVGMVEVREIAYRLALAIESAVNTIFSKSHNIGNKWRDALSMFWSFACDVASAEPSDTSEDQPIRHTIYLELTRKEHTAPWKLQDKLELEGLLGLWIWSLKSDPAVELSDSQSHFTISQATEIQTRRIVSTNKNIETDLKIWLGTRIPIITEYELHPTSVQRGDPSTTKWKLSGEEDKEIRFFGWHTVQESQSPNPIPKNVMSAHTDSSLLSLCAQEVFGSFIASILKISDDIGDINIQETPHFRLESSLVTEMMNLFAETQLGSNEDALLCILPTVIPQLRLSYTENAVVAAKKIANQHRRAGEWAQAERVLRWAWEVCNESQLHARKNNSQNDQPIHADEPIQQTALALCELYRWATRVNEMKEFGLRGMGWLSDQKPSRQEIESLALDEIIDLYHDIAKRVVQHGNNVSGIRLNILRGIKDESTAEISPIISDSTDEISEAKDDLRKISEFKDDSSEIFQIEDDLSGVLFYITLPIPMTNEDKGKVLGLAAKHGWTEVVLALLELGAEPEFKDLNSRTALSQAAENGSINTMKALIHWGAFPNSTDSKYRTPLSYASEMGHSSVTRILLEDQRVDPNAKDMRGLTPLLWAVENKHEAVVELLAECGKVDLNAKDYDGNTPLRLAARNGHEAVVKLLIQKGIDLNTKDDNGYTPLMLAGKAGHDTVVKVLAQKGADLNGKDNDGYTPLTQVAMHNRYALVKVLVESGADINAKDGKGYTPLTSAVKHGYKAVVEALVESGADINAKNGNGYTPLRLAVQNGDTTIVKVLAESGADLNAKERNGYTPLFIAAIFRHEAIIKLLIESGADPNVEDGEGETALSLAREDGNKAIVKLLESYHSHH